MYYKYSDDSIGVARQVLSGGYAYPAGYLAQRASETEAEWIGRIAAIGVAPVRYEQPASYDAATQIKGDPVGALDADGWWAVTWPNVTDRPQAELNAARIAAIKTDLTALDQSAVRPLRAILAAQQAGTDVDATDVSQLADLESQAQALRIELAGLMEA